MTFVVCSSSSSPSSSVLPASRPSARRRQLWWWAQANSRAQDDLLSALPQFGTTTTRVRATAAAAAAAAATTVSAGLSAIGTIYWTNSDELQRTTTTPGTRGAKRTTRVLFWSEGAASQGSTSQGSLQTIQEAPQLRRASLCNKTCAPNNLDGNDSIVEDEDNYLEHRSQRETVGLGCSNLLLACDKLVIRAKRQRQASAAIKCGGGGGGVLAQGRARCRAQPISGLNTLDTLQAQPLNPTLKLLLLLLLLLYATINSCSLGHCFLSSSLSPAAGFNNLHRRLGGRLTAQATSDHQLNSNNNGNNLTQPEVGRNFAQLAIMSANKQQQQQQQQRHHMDSVQQVNSGSSASASADEERAAHWSLPNRPSLFSIIRFPNEECFDSSNQSGTCYTAFECKLLGGQPSSPCAAGFGSCCIVSRTCHVTTREKVVYFKNPSYPSADSDEKFCDLTVEMGDINVCQLRLDFLDFQLDPPSHGACKDDYMEISASGMPPQTVPRLCGMNRNQHLYINLPQDFTERSASIVFYTDPVGDHRWQVKVTQIDCNHYRPLDWKRHYAKFASSPLWNAHPVSNGGVRLPALGGGGLGAGASLGKYSTTFASGFQTMSQTASALAYEFLRPQFTPRAPMGCLQYFTQPSGIIESFNFGQYLNNMDYSICIQRQPDTCRVVFTSSDYDWSLNGVGISGSSSGVGDQDCARDYLLIPGASRTGDGFTYDRYCGGRLNYYRGQSLSAPVVMKTSGPIVLRFHSDAHFESVNQGGFRLQYDQSTQDCIYHTAEEAGSLSSQQLLASTLADSRPLGPFSQQDAPALYASQQLGSVPTVSGQQQAHQDYRLDSTLESGATSSSIGSSIDSIKPIRQLQSVSLANDSAGGGGGGGHGGNSQQLINSNSFDLLQAVNLVGDNKHQIRRNDYNENDGGGGAGNSLSYGQAQINRQQQQQQQLSTISESPAPSLGLDLSKAFQLITARSSRAMGGGGAQKQAGAATSGSKRTTRTATNWTQ